ncbi:hypothetical protein ABT124_44425, partial [Streptomyces sp. NPDC001982]|uniref:hypothetical protein n=1 Tax=Streptomyces sp. NPDC001982 TaxID=3154405 RepID=UPI003318F7ED
PAVPPNPVEVATVLRDVVGTGGGVSCDARGARTPGPILPPGPAVPPNPVEVATVLRDVVGTGGGVSCDARGAQTFRLNLTTETPTFTGAYDLYPPDPVQPQNAACAGHRIGVRYVAHLDAAGQVIGTPTATAVDIDIPPLRPEPPTTPGPSRGGPLTHQRSISAGR